MHLIALKSLHKGWTIETKKNNKQLNSKHILVTIVCIKNPSVPYLDSKLEGWNQHSKFGNRDILQDKKLIKISNAI